MGPASRSNRHCLNLFFLWTPILIFFSNIYCVLLLTHVFCEILKDAATEFSTWFRRGQKWGTMVSQEFLERRGDVTGTFDAKSSQKEYWFAHDQQLRHGDEKAGWGVETLTSKHSGSNPFAVRNLCPQPESKEERKKKKKKKGAFFVVVVHPSYLRCHSWLFNRRETLYPPVMTAWALSAYPLRRTTEISGIYLFLLCLWLSVDLFAAQRWNG